MTPRIGRPRVRIEEFQQRSVTKPDRLQDGDQILGLRRPVDQEVEIEIGQRCGFGVAVLLGFHQRIMQLFELLEVGARQQRHGLFRRQPLEEQADLAKLAVAGQRQPRHRDGLPRTHLEPALADQLHDGFAHRRVAHAHRLGQLADTQALSRPESSGHQGLTQLAIGARRQILATAGNETLQSHLPIPNVAIAPREPVIERSRSARDTIVAY